MTTFRTVMDSHTATVEDAGATRAYFNSHGRTYVLTFPHTHSDRYRIGEMTCHGLTHGRAFYGFADALDYLAAHLAPKSFGHLADKGLQATA